MMGVSLLGSAAIAEDINSDGQIMPVSNSEPIAQTELSDSDDLETGIDEFDWDLPNQDPPTQFGSPVLLPIQLTPPANEDADGFAVTIDLTELDKLETVENNR